MKVTWNDIYKDFKALHPKLSKQCLRFEAYDFATILLIFPDRVRMTYNYDTKKVTKVKFEEVEKRVSGRFG